MFLLSCHNRITDLDRRVVSDEFSHDSSRCVAAQQTLDQRWSQSKACYLPASGSWQLLISAVRNRKKLRADHPDLLSHAGFAGFLSSLVPRRIKCPVIDAFCP